jgi:hypothetical protein
MGAVLRRGLTVGAAAPGSGGSGTLTAVVCRTRRGPNEPVAAQPAAHRWREGSLPVLDLPPQVDPRERVPQAGSGRDRLWRVMIETLDGGMIPNWWPLLGRELMNAAAAGNWPWSGPVG